MGAWYAVLVIVVVLVIVGCVLFGLRGDTRRTNELRQRRDDEAKRRPNWIAVMGAVGRDEWVPKADGDYWWGPIARVEHGTLHLYERHTKTGRRRHLMTYACNAWRRYEESDF